MYKYTYIWVYQYAYLNIYYVSLALDSVLQSTIINNNGGVITAGRFLNGSVSKLCLYYGSCRRRKIKAEVSWQI